MLEVGVGGVAALHEYYQEYILKFEDNMRKKVEEMLEKQRIEFDACNKYTESMIFLGIKTQGLR